MPRVFWYVTARFLKMAGMALFSLAIASGQGGAPGCHATPQETRKELPWAGNAGEIQWSADQADCKVDSGGLPWVVVTVLPPVSGNATQRVLRYAVDTNFSTEKREGKIQVGDSSVTLEQAGGPPPGMGFSPSRLEFTITPDLPGKEGALEATKTLFVGSEEPLRFTAAPEGPAATWIMVKDAVQAPSSPQAHHSFLVTVTAEGKAPGVYQGMIQINAPGAANAKELVPVTMTVEKAKVEKPQVENPK
jgi:hypothetical protein